jgi:hypothetical protein
MIGKSYITPNLVLPFLHMKPIRFKFSNEQEYLHGDLAVEIFEDGTCNIQILNARRGHADWHSEGQFLNSDMIGKISWDAEKQEFLAIF